MKLSEPPATPLSKDDSNDAEASLTAPSVTSNREDEPIRPFVYRAPVGKSSSTTPSHPNRRSSDVESRGN